MRTVGELIQGKSFYTANSDQSVYETARYMAEKDIGAVPILEDNRLVGIFSERDIIRRVIVAGRDVRPTLGQEVMNTELVVAPKTEENAQVLEKKQKNRWRPMPGGVGARL